MAPVERREWGEVVSCRRHSSTLVVSGRLVLVSSSLIFTLLVLPPPIGYSTPRLNI
jgi:hypothetical protein